MKKALFLSVLLLALVATLHAQAPRSINSQAVLRDAAGRLIANQSVGVRIIIAQGFPTGTVAYEETHIATTNDNGLYTITIGAGTPATGTFATIDWANGPYFITTDIDPAGGTNYIITTSQQFLSVPYALLADTAVRVARATTATDATHATNADHSTLSDNATNAVYADTALYYRERQVLTRSNDTIYLTGGSYVVLPHLADTHYVDSITSVTNSNIGLVYNELRDSVNALQQRLIQINSFTPDTIYVVNNGYDTIIRHFFDTTHIYHNDTTHAYYIDTVTIVSYNHTYDTLHSYHYDTVLNTIANHTYDTTHIQHNDTINTHHFDTVTLVSYNHTYDTLHAYHKDTIHEYHYDTVAIVTNNHTYDTTHTYHYDTVQNTIANHIYDTVHTYHNDIVHTQHYDTVNIVTNNNIYDTIRINKYDTVRTNHYDTVNIVINNHIYDTVRINRYDTLRTHDTVIVYDYVAVHSCDSALIAEHADSSIYADTALFYQEQQVLTIGHDTIYLTGGSYVVLPPSSNANINNHYIDSVVGVRTTTVVNNLQNQLADSSRMLRSAMRDTTISLMRDSLISIIRDSSTTIQQSISVLPVGTCYATCGSVDSLRCRQDSAQRAFDSIVGIHTSVLHRNDSVINVQRKSIRHYDSIIHSLDSVVNVYDSLIVHIKHICDSVSGEYGSSVEITDGALPGVFSVSPTKQVRFSQGNLQYQASTNTWRFAEHQYDYVGDDISGNVYVGSTKCNNANISASYDGWIDLFGWATSGYHDPSDANNTFYRPYDINYYNDYRCYGPSTSTSLVGASRNYDWGVYNAISNGGNVAGSWRTLTYEECQYLFSNSSSARTNFRISNSAIRVLNANVCGVSGRILFPDNFSYPYGMLPTITKYDVDNSNIIFDCTQWAILEKRGCVFLPKVGRRERTTINSNGSSVYNYWTSSYDEGNRAYARFFSGVINRSYGLSVRLVQDL